MLKIIKVSDERLDIELDGKLNTEEMKQGLDELVEKSKDIHHGKMLYTIIEFHFPTFGAMIHEFSRLPSMLALIKNFDRAAVLTDKVWLQKASEIEGMLLPWLEIKAFKLNEKEAAEIWLMS